MTIKTELELLKKDVSDMKHIHSRLDTAITIQELHSRVTSNYKEIVTLISKHNSDDIERFHQLQRELSNRVGILEKWRWIIIGGSIVAGFILHKVIMFAI